MVKYGRASGNKQVTRYCRVDQLGKVSYVEKRVTPRRPEENGIPTDMYKLGNVAYVAAPLNQVLPATKSAFDKMVKEALSNIL